MLNLFKGPNRVGVSLYSPEDGNRSTVAEILLSRANPDHIRSLFETDRVTVLGTYVTQTWIGRRACFSLDLAFHIHVVLRCDNEKWFAGCSLELNHITLPRYTGTLGSLREELC
jgi:hypothetical protein